MPDVFIQFLNGNSDAEIVNGTTNLRTKRGGAGCPLINVPLNMRTNPTAPLAPLDAALTGANGANRIYLRGHGNWATTTLGGWGPKSVAMLLKTHGLAHGKVISITGCNLARAAAVGEPENVGDMEFQTRKALATRQLDNALCSFAGRFHLRLGDPLPMPVQNIPVTARMYSVQVEADGRKRLRIGANNLQKAGVGSARWAKVIFRWAQGAQSRSWVLPGVD